jgi:predicted phage terminase large subunit-like protein
MRREYVYPLAINPKGDKLSRVQAITPYLERGEVLLPDNAPWIDDFLAETALYPQGRYDDQVDALAQYLNWVEDGTRPKGGILQMTGGHRS